MPPNGGVGRSALPPHPTPKMRLRALCVAVAITVCARRAAAQSLEDLTAGVRVRVYGIEATPEGTRKYEAAGQVAGRDSIRLVIIRDGATKFDTLPFFAMTTLQMNQGRITRAKLMASGAAVGALAGTALWIIARQLSGDPTDGPPPGGDLKHVAKVSIPVLAALGLTIGAISDTDVWVAVRIPPSVYGR